MKEGWSRAQTHMGRRGRRLYLEGVLQLVGVVEPRGLHQGHDQLLELPCQLGLQVVQQVLLREHRALPGAHAALRVFAGNGGLALKGSPAGGAERSQSPGLGLRGSKASLRVKVTVPEMFLFLQELKK